MGTPEMMLKTSLSGLAQRDTKGLKKGDIVYYNDGHWKYNAIVINVTSTQKAQIRPLTHIDNIINPTYIINTYRKFMTIVNN